MEFLDTDILRISKIIWSCTSQVRFLKIMLKIRTVFNIFKTITAYWDIIYIPSKWPFNSIQWFSVYAELCNHCHPNFRTFSSQAQKKKKKPISSDYPFSLSPTLGSHCSAFWVYEFAALGLSHQQITYIVFRVWLLSPRAAFPRFFHAAACISTSFQTLFSIFFLLFVGR